MSTGTFDCIQYLESGFAQALGKVRLPSPLVLQVVVPGRPECRVHYRLGGAELSVARGFAEAADVTLSIQAPELEQLAHGALDLDAAMILERVRFFGHPQRLTELQAALGGAAGGAGR
jgi:hypothetical protein